MTSYQELTAEGENSPLLTGCCRVKEVINQDLGSRFHPELGGRDEESKVEVEVASGFYSPHLTLCTASDSPPPPPSRFETLEGFSTLACPHSSRVPWRCRAQGQGSPGHRYRASNKEKPHRFGSLTEEIQIYPQNSPEIHVAVRSSSSSDSIEADTDERSKTFEWMRVKRSQHRAGKFLSKDNEREREG